MKNSTIESHRVRVKETGSIVFKKFNTLLFNDIVESDSSEVIEQVWKEIDCKSCANCCKSSSPILNVGDIERIASHFKMNNVDFTNKYLNKKNNPSDKEMWEIKTKPCSFLDLDTNLCTIYDVRPDSCSTWPNIQSKSLLHNHDQHSYSILHCPATYRWVELMIENSKI
jgi:Fe-S-cluster containining protein